MLLPVLRMLSDYVGEDLFLKGVSLYLKKHLYANSVTKDLWEGIATATGLSHLTKHLTSLKEPLPGIDINRLMDNWISKVSAGRRVSIVANAISDGFSCADGHGDLKRSSCPPGSVLRDWSCRPKG